MKKNIPLKFFSYKNKNKVHPFKSYNSKSSLSEFCINLKEDAIKNIKNNDNNKIILLYLNFNLFIAIIIVWKNWNGNFKSDKF